MVSNRKDGRGGWTAGKHRNQPAEHWTRTVVVLQQSPEPSRALARRIGTTEGSIRRWLSGRAIPAIEMQNQVRYLLTESP